jgi:hypothetical protein
MQRFTKESRTDRLEMRLTPSEKKALRAAADSLGETEADVIRRALDYWFSTAPESPGLKTLDGSAASKARPVRRSTQKVKGSSRTSPSKAT